MLDFLDGRRKMESFAQVFWRQHMLVIRGTAAELTIALGSSLRHEVARLVYQPGKAATAQGAQILRGLESSRFTI